MSEISPKTTFQDLWRLSWPMMLTMFLVFSVGLADVYVAGRFSPAVQGAIGFAGQLLFFFGVLANGLGVGLVAMVSRHEGAGEQPAMWHAARQGILLACLLTGPLSLIGLTMSPDATTLSFLPPSVAAAAEKLLPIYAASLWPQALLTTTAAIFRARTRMRLILLCSGSTAILNLIGDFILAFGFGPLPALGPIGIAIATAASSAVGAGLALAILFAQGMGIRDWRPDIPFLKGLIELSWPAAMLQMGWHLGSLVLYAILGRLSTAAVAATAALTNGLRIEAILYLPVYALNMITAVLVAQALGAADPDEAERIGWRVAKTAAVILAAMALPVFIFSRQLAGTITPDPLVREMTHVYLRFNMISQPFMALGVCLAGALEGAGDTRGTMMVVLATLWGFRLPIAAILALATPLAANGVWIAMVASMIMQYVAMHRRYQRGRWKKIALFSSGAPSTPANNSGSHG